MSTALLSAQLPSVLHVAQVARQHVPQRPAVPPEAPTEAEARAGAWFEEAVAAVKRPAGASVSPPKQMRTQLPPWVFEAIERERQQGSADAELAGQAPGDDPMQVEGDWSPSAEAGEAAAQAAEADSTAGGAAVPAVKKATSNSSSPQAKVAVSGDAAPLSSSGVSMFSPLPAQTVVALYA